MDIPAPSQPVNTAATDDNQDTAEKVVLGDPLANMKLDDNNNLNIGANNSDLPNIIPNETIETNDNSVVGDFEKIKAEAAKKSSEDLSSLTAFMTPNIPLSDDDTDKTPSPETDPKPITEAPSPVTAPIAPSTEPNDPEKEVFIKTYTEEFDQTLRRATEAAGQILDAIDNTIRKHLPDIAITKEADEFLENPPTDHKVEKFDDAQKIVQEIMAKANEAKAQSTEAADEAAKVYDEVQNFKNSTHHQIDNLVKGMDLDELKKSAENEKTLDHDSRDHIQINPIDFAKSTRTDADEFNLSDEAADN